MNKKVILVVDDSRQITDFLTESVLPSLGFDTLVAYCGQAGLDILRQKYQSISLMIIDLQLPDIDGLDVLRKSIREEINIPAILMTAYGSEKVVVEAFRLGVQDYLTKPIDIDELDQAISRALVLRRLQQEKSKLTDQLREKVSWLKALSNVGQSVTSILELDAVLRRIVEAGIFLTHADQGFIALLDSESKQLILRAVKNIKQEKVNTLRLPVEDSLVGQALKTNLPVRKSSPNKEDLFKVSTGLLVHDLIHVPISYQNKPLGVLSVNNYQQKRSFTKRDEIMLTSLADYASIAIENANSFEQAQKELEKRKRISEALRKSEERYALAVRGTNDGLWDWDLISDEIYYSPRWKEILGYRQNTIKQEPSEWFQRVKCDDLDQLKHDISVHIRSQTSHFENEHRLLHKDGTYRWVLCRGASKFNTAGEAVRLAGSIADITDRKKAEQQLLHDALHDALTDLPNRQLFLDHLDQSLQKMKRKQDYGFAVLFLDIDDFKDINDSIGHQIGDLFLIELSQILKKGLRSVDILARFGGDEFLILLEDVQDEADVRRVTNWIMERFSQPFNIAGHEINSSVSIGVVISQPDYTNTQEIIRNADIAMYAAKARGRGKTKVFEKSMHQHFLKRLNFESGLQTAIQKNELIVYYQPIVTLGTGKLIGFEALVRWRHPNRGILEPIEFIKLAEETGLILEIDHRVLFEACQQIQIWNEKYNRDFTISVNFSGKHVSDPNLLSVIKKAIAKTNLKPQNLKIEITERSIIAQNQITSAAFKEMQNLGIQMQIDDFGVGYSSLGYLNSLPINALKIDQTFIGGICSGSSHRDIVEAIILLTKRFNVEVIAEGIETKEQLEELRNLGCQSGQGYLIAIPMSASDIDSLIARIVRKNNALIFED
jgi:diguanylate cyclase (GGDEF)-like protein/PAS domain S-box-containing protein